ncbi:SigE family RNA polymerase sigma factor [Streptomyces marincola]|uniref:SigE family RNA polymerase sigma factor n=1 Tax=Streptomyces marincola TaxID=2878388 RepID=A0A1W7CZY2_9ACTN|nr:SigE family RNA polymerase sigma factor [Streptomyces marincola]ARQ69870.1 SigE family RNA polymerase sigma factor [Streptomyces marincola]UCM88980.1 SigE family RNA polymerase sigma factor [Streptomyces marincola]
MRESVEADFRSFMTSRWTRLLRTAYLLAGNHHDAEDLAQTALTKAYCGWERVRRADDPDAYVWRIMINVHRDRLRGIKLREWLTSWLPERAAADGSERVVVRGALMQALGRLSPKQRAVVVLRYLEDRSETEVAALLGMGVGTVRTHSARGLRRLREDSALSENIAREVVTR